VRQRLLILLCSVAALGLVVVAVVDLFSLGPGTCGPLAQGLWPNCWGARLLRSLTGWPTNIAAALADVLFAVLAVVLAFATARKSYDEPVQTKPAPRGHAGLLVPLAMGVGAGLLVRMNGSSYWDAFVFGLFACAYVGLWSLRHG